MIVLLFRLLCVIYIAINDNTVTEDYIVEFFIDTYKILLHINSWQKAYS